MLRARLLFPLPGGRNGQQLLCGQLDGFSVRQPEFLPVLPLFLLALVNHLLMIVLFQCLLQVVAGFLHVGHVLAFGVSQALPHLLHGCAFHFVEYSRRLQQAFPQAVLCHSCQCSLLGVGFPQAHLAHQGITPLAQAFLPVVQEHGICIDDGCCIAVQDVPQGVQVLLIQLVQLLAHCLLQQVVKLIFQVAVIEVLHPVNGLVRFSCLVVGQLHVGFLGLLDYILPDHAIPGLPAFHVREVGHLHQLLHALPHVPRHEPGGVWLQQLLLDPLVGADNLPPCLALLLCFLLHGVPLLHLLPCFLPHGCHAVLLPCFLPHGCHAVLLPLDLLSRLADFLFQLADFPVLAVDLPLHRLHCIRLHGTHGRHIHVVLVDVHGNLAGQLPRVEFKAILLGLLFQPLVCWLHCLQEVQAGLECASSYILFVNEPHAAFALFLSQRMVNHIIATVVGCSFFVLYVPRLPRRVPHSRHGSPKFPGTAKGIFGFFPVGFAQCHPAVPEVVQQCSCVVSICLQCCVIHLCAALNQVLGDVRHGLHGDLRLTGCLGVCHGVKGCGQVLRQCPLAHPLGCPFLHQLFGQLVHVLLLHFLDAATAVHHLLQLPHHFPEVLAVLDLLPHVLVDLVHPLQAGQYPRVFLQAEPYIRQQLAVHHGRPAFVRSVIFQHPNALFCCKAYSVGVLRPVSFRHHCRTNAAFVFYPADRFRFKHGCAAEMGVFALFDSIQHSVGKVFRLCIA